MRTSQSLRSDELSGLDADLAHYWRDGYAIVRGFFGSRRDRSNYRQRWTSFTPRASRTAAASGTATFSTMLRTARDGEPLVRMVQWPSYHQRDSQPRPASTRGSRDLLAPLIGGDLKQIINQVHWKAPRLARRFRVAPGQQVRAARPRLIAISRRPMSSPASRSIRTIPRPVACASSPAAICAATFTWIARGIRSASL